MDDAEINARQSSDESVMCELNRSVCSGEQLNDAVISDAVADMRHHLRGWKERHDVTARAKDNILFCMSTLLAATRKKLCTKAALLDAMVDANFGLIVSKLCFILLYCRHIWLW